VLKDQANKAAHASSAQLACEAAGSIRTVAALTREEDCCALYSESLEEPLRQSNRTSIWSNLLFSVSQSMTFFVIALVFWYGSRLVSYQEFSLFQFFVGLMVRPTHGRRVLAPHEVLHPSQSSVFGAMQAGNVFTFVPDVSSARGAASDIVKLLDSRPEIDSESTSGKKLEGEKLRGHLRVEDIHFRYPTRPSVRVLRELSLTVEPGTYIALVGASGSGKSTVYVFVLVWTAVAHGVLRASSIQMIERFYDPLAGQIRVSVICHFRLD
jgi:ATP-binding cassette, subfamily B (MDR/TAP), member 1